MRVLITGASGFIGRALSQSLSREPGCEVYTVVRQTISGADTHANEIVADLAIPDWTSRLSKPVDVVIHLAQSNRYREFPDAVSDIVGVNVNATLELADWGRRNGIRRFLYASTGNVYGSSSIEAKEDASPSPRGMYATSKRCAELLLEPYTEFFEIVVMRLFGVYGPGQRGMTISRLIDQVLADEEITLSGRSGVRLNPIYIDDCVAIIRRLSDIDPSERYEIINIGGTEAVDLLEVIRIVQKLAGRNPRIRFSDGKVVNLIGDTGKLAKRIPGRRDVSLEEGLRRCIAAREAQP